MQHAAAQHALNNPEKERAREYNNNNSNNNNSNNELRQFASWRSLLVCPAVWPVCSFGPTSLALTVTFALCLFATCGNSICESHWRQFRSRCAKDLPRRCTLHKVISSSAQHGSRAAGEDYEMLCPKTIKVAGRAAT